MTTTTRRALRYSVHASATDLTTEPTIYHLLPREPAILRPSPHYQNIERGQQRIGGAVELGLRGRKRNEMPDLVVELEGLSVGAGSGTDATTRGGIHQYMALAHLGQESSASTGDSSSGADAGSGTTITADANPITLTVGNFALVPTTIGGEYQVRMITATSGADATINTALTTQTGAADTALESDTYYAFRTWSCDTDLNNHQHLFFREEFSDFETTLNGCLASDVEWTLQGGQPVLMSLTGLKCTDWDDDSSLSGVTYSAPTSGNKVVCTPLYLWIDGTLYLASELKVSLGMMVADRPHDGSDTGMWGRVVKGFKPMISGRLIYGSHSNPDEIDETALAALEGTYPYSAPTSEILIQAGARPSAAAAWYAPSARLFNFSRQVVDGAVVMDFEAECTSATTGNVTAPLYFGFA